MIDTRAEHSGGASNLQGSDPNRRPERGDKRGRRTPRERRFVANSAPRDWLGLSVGLLGSLALGAGFYSGWISDPAGEYAMPLIGVGLVGLGFGAFRLLRGARPVRVGDAGVATEQGSEMLRLLWCEIEGISLDHEQLVVRGKASSIAVPLELHARAASRILKEAALRLPAILDVPRNLVDRLPPPTDEDAPIVVVAGLQIAGHRCRSSKEVITFERDARLCPNCAEVYHHRHLPKNCMTCERSMDHPLVVG